MTKQWRWLPLFCVLVLFTAPSLQADDGYDLWLRYKKITDQTKLEQYTSLIRGFDIQGDSPTLDVLRNELSNGLKGLFGTAVAPDTSLSKGGILVLGTPETSAYLKELDYAEEANLMGSEGFLIYTIEQAGQSNIIIQANTDIGLLYGTFHFLHLLQTHQDIQSLSIFESPQIRHRILNHWDNLDRTVERGYAGFSLWDWHKLPDYSDPRYEEYARANASIGINGTVLTNPKTDATLLTKPYLQKVAALANIFRPYGIKVYLPARFSAPIEIGGLKTADPQDSLVVAWWQQKVAEIHEYIPDFGGFQVQANAENQPSPQDYNRTHADGANMFADLLRPYKGIVMWRAYISSGIDSADQSKQAYAEFTPMDGMFRENVLLQIKSGPLNFQPREPFHPLFGSLSKTPLMLEFQITKEYLGQSTHLVYLAPMYREVLLADTYAQGSGSRVSSIVDGSIHGYAHTGIAGVSNIGTDRNWCGSLFDCANWYAFGKMAWNPGAPSRDLADQWVRMTFSNEPAFKDPVIEMMITSWQACINYMTPLGLNFLAANEHRYGPAPWDNQAPSGDTPSTYVPRADAEGLGFDRSPEGSNAVEQYLPPLNEIYGSRERIPEKYLLWFHHIPWDYVMRSGRSLWSELAHRYQSGVDAVHGMQKTWASLENMIDAERYDQVKAFLAIQAREARWWKDSNLLYFQTFSNMDIPAGIDKPAESLDYYMDLSFPYVPGQHASIVKTP